MPYGRDTTVVSETQKTTYRFVFLFEVDSDHGTEYYVNSNAPVTVSGQKYTPMAIKINAINRGGGVQVGRLQLTIDNTELDYSTALQAGDYDGQEVRIYIHFPDIPDSKELWFKGKIESFRLNLQEVTVEVLPSTDYMVFTVPKRRFMTKCPWVFKDPDTCGYTGSETSCDKTYDTCKNVMNNASRFGGFPYIKVP